jgi:nitrogen fixation/metabolism regulation signal transduction histidine kinase
MRTVLMFGALVIAPLIIVYLFSLDFINRGIDSWFRVEIKQGLNDALVLSRSALDLRLREQARRTEIFARSLRELRGAGAVAAARRGAARHRAKEIIVYDANGRASALSSDTPMLQQPAPAPPDVALQVAAGRSYVSLNPLPNGQYTIETAAPIADAVGIARKAPLRADRVRGAARSSRLWPRPCSTPRRSTAICRQCASR